MNLTSLELAKDRARIYKNYLQMEIDAKANINKLAFLDRGIEKSPYQQQIKNYPDYLKQKPDGIKVISSIPGPNNPLKLTPFPSLGELPQINSQALNFLHADIKEACVCIGTFVDGKIQAQWLGKNALTNAEQWSATKIIALLNIVSQVNTKYPDCDIDNCVVRDGNGQKHDFYFYDVAKDMINYASNIGSSNSLAAMFKRFDTRIGLEQWLKSATGNNDLIFRGDYGENPYLNNPKIFDITKKQVLLSAALNSTKQKNSVSAYDLTRLISMLGWHFHIEQRSRMKGAQWNSLESIVRAMGHDTARYVDVAIKTLGMDSLITSPVIISKLGYGLSSIRGTLETVYVALVRFVDERPKAAGKPAKLRTLAMSLRAEKPVGGSSSVDRLAIELDARFCAEVTEILRRLFAEEF
ncbi:hypothetical protein NDI47_22415 [Microcoleus vaginatus GB1-A2]|uniref:hypothetical protein n=1 Tax=Microcoleus vaginatus TaxID=119532 RepID=UPI0016825EDD|nr:hypothetical protein [Microcoleus sp. FACHB-61]